MSKMTDFIMKFYPGGGPGGRRRFLSFEFFWSDGSMPLGAVSLLGWEGRLDAAGRHLCLGGDDGVGGRDSAVPLDSAALHLAHGLRPMKKCTQKAAYVPARHSFLCTFFRTAHCLLVHYTPISLTRKVL